MVDNKPGAGGNTGADFVAKAPPDGLTIVVGTVGTHAINGALLRQDAVRHGEGLRARHVAGDDAEPARRQQRRPRQEALAELIALGKREAR